MPDDVLCSEPGCPVVVGGQGHYCLHHDMHSAADGECGPGCPPPWPDVPGLTGGSTPDDAAATVTKGDLGVSGG